MDIKITGSIPIVTDIHTEESLQDFAERSFPELINISDGTMYISGHVDEDELSLVEEFLVKIFSIADTSETHRIKLKDESNIQIGEYVIDEDGIVMNSFAGTHGVTTREIHQA